MTFGESDYGVELPQVGIKDALEADLVVIGGGGAGLPAALKAKEAGVGRVIVLEKRFAPGGDALRCNHIFACESPLQKRVGSIVSRDEIFRQALEFHHYRVNPALLRTLINQTTDSIAWLEEKGVRFKLLLMGKDLKTATTHVVEDMPEPDSLCSLGKVFRLLIQRAVDSGVQFLVRTRGSKIIRGEDGSVTGVIAETRDGRSIRISTRAIILCPGSFIGNKDLLKKYFSSEYDEIYYTDALLSNVGDGLSIAEEAGAAMSEKCTIIRHAYSFRTIVNFRHENLPPSAILVNKKGQRFIDEGLRDAGANVLIHQPDKVGYFLADDNVIQSVIDRGTIPVQYSSRLPTPFDQLPDYVKDFRKYLQVRVKEGWVRIADNWDEIAGWIGCDPVVLKETVSGYNSFCDAGYDGDFAKDKRYLMPLRKPPYYAVHVRPLMIETIGPVVINEKMEVLDRAGKPIPGFFAAGVITSGWEGSDYGGTPNGTALSFSIGSGLIAARSAADYLAGRVSA